MTIKGPPVDSQRANSTGLVAIRVTVVSVIVGAIYVAYIMLDDFPPDILRIVPAIWLIGAFTGFMLGIRSMLVDDQRLHGLISILINVANIPLAAIFMLGAAMGD